MWLSTSNADYRTKPSTHRSGKACPHAITVQLMSEGGGSRRGHRVGGEQETRAYDKRRETKVMMVEGAREEPGAEVARWGPTA